MSGKKMKRQTRINAIVATAIVIFTATYLSPPSLANTATDAVWQEFDPSKFPTC